jgi:general secretion pathway protein M
MTIKNIPIIAAAIERYSSLTDRDQFAINMLSLFALALFVFFLIVQPSKQYSQSSQAHYQSSQQSFAWMQANQAQVANLSSQLNQRAPGQSLLGIANESSKSYQLSFKRYQPVADNGLSLWLEAVRFNDLVLWIERLDKDYGIIVKEIAIDREQQLGLVNVRLVLQG